MNFSSRRDFFTGLGVGAVVLANRSAAQTAAARPPIRRIDVHHHITPPAFLSFLDANKQNHPIQWSLAKSLEDMDQGGTTTALTSITSPGVWFGDVAGVRKVARGCNEYSAKLTADYPGRFGTFATLPLPDIDGSLREVEYALDTLKADGVCMWTNYEDKWLGDPVFDLFIRS